MPPLYTDRMQASLDAMRSARAAEDQQIHDRQWSAFDTRRAAVAARRQPATRASATSIPMVAASREDNLRAAMEAEKRGKQASIASFAAWKKETGKKEADYNAGKEVRLGANGQIVAKRTAAIDAQRLAQNAANAMRKRAELAQYYAKQGKQVVYGPAGSMAIAANAPIPEGFNGMAPMGPGLAMASRPPLPIGVRPPTMVSPDSDIAVASPPEPMPPQAPFVPAGVARMQGVGGAGAGAMGQEGFKQIVQAATRILGRIPKSLDEIKVALGGRPSTSPRRTLPGDELDAKIIGSIKQLAPWGGGESIYSGSM